MGWAFVGASRSAALTMLEAMRTLPPLPDGSVQAWAAAIHSHAPFRAQAFAEQNAIAHWESDLDALLERPAIRCVYVANHPRHHAESTLAALRAGKHVLCEPPLALEPEEALRIHQFAQARRLTLGLHYQHRTDPAFVSLRGRIADHELGDLVGGSVHNAILLPVHQQSWRVEAAWGGVMIERTLRTVDAVRFLAGDEIAQASAIAGADVFGQGERRQTSPGARRHFDDLHALLKLERSEAVFGTHDSFLIPHAPTRIDIYGSAGSAAIVPWQSLRLNQLARYRGGMLEEVRLSSTPLNQWQLSIVAFQAAVQAGVAPPASAVEEMANHRVIGALLESLGKGAEAVSIASGGR